MKSIRIAELFAGVGGFRLGLEAVESSKHKYRTVWANQWEPSTKRQHACEVYTARFGDKELDCRNIEEVIQDDFETIPDHDLLVGGFPCQDYSVASTLKNSKGLIGKKGVLFWSIYSILKNKGDKAPNYLFLENVDRLLKSPASQRGKDFAVMLAALTDLGYAIEWRVVNAAEYGFPQRRKRIFIIGYKQGTRLHKQATDAKNKATWLVRDGVLPTAFSVENNINVEEFEITGTYAQITTDFSANAPKVSPFKTAGVAIGRKIYTGNVTEAYDGPQSVLGDILLNEKDIDEEFFISDEKIKNWTYLKGAKSEERKTSTGHVYHYSEGSMTFPDALDRPSRTIITGEGGTGPSRFKHVIKTKSGRYRRLTPIELERLNMFPDHHTKLDGVSDTKRAFFMGNALVVGAIEKVGSALAKRM